MSMKRVFALWALVLAILTSNSIAEAQRRNRDKEDDKKKEPEVVLQPRPSGKEEFDAFQAIQNDQNPSTRVPLADAFLAKYPTSELNGFVQRFRMEALSRTGKHKEAIAAADAAMKFELDFYNKKDQTVANKNTEEWKKFMSEAAQARLYYLQNQMNSYQQLNDAPKTVETAELILEDNPEDLFALLTLSSVMAERPSTDEKQKEKEMKRAEEAGKKAVSMLSARAAVLPPDQKANLMSSAHSTMGLIYLNQKKFGDSQKEYLTSITHRKDDPVAWFRLGLAYAQEKPAKVDDAMQALAKSVFLKGVTENQAKDILTQLYQQQKKSLDGLDQYIKDAGAKIM